MQGILRCPLDHVWTLPGPCPTCGQESVTVLASETVPRGGPISMPVVPGYTVHCEIGRGGMGVVYKATHLALNRVVAMKVLRSGEIPHAQDRTRFVREAEVVAKLRHPNIVQVFDVGIVGDALYFTMEYINGTTLHEWHSENAETIAKLIATIARAADYAHQQGVVHRDLKPANILMTEDGTPKLVDFGLAKQLTLDEGLSQTGNLLGTPSYMAPEQAAGRVREVGPATDTYAIGVILFKLLTGRVPFDGMPMFDTLQAIIHHEPPAPSAFRANVPRDLDFICLKALQKKPAERYESAAALADDLDRFLGHEPIRAGRTPVWQVAKKWCRRHPAYAVAIGIGILSLIGLLAGLSLFARQQSRHAAELRKERDRITLERDQAAEANRGLIRTIDAFYSGRPLDKDEVQALDRGVAFYERDGVPQDAEGKFQLAMALRFRGRLPHDLRGPDQPLAADEEAAYVRAEALFRELETDTTYSEAARLAGANTRNNLGNACRSRAAWPQAERWYTQSINGLTALSQEHAAKPEYALYLANAIRNWGWGEALKHNEGRKVDLSAAEKRVEKATLLHAENIPKLPSQLSRFLTWQSEAHQTLVTLHELQGDEAKTRAAIDRWVQASGAMPAHRLKAAMALANAYERWKNPRDADVCMKWLETLVNLGALSKQQLNDPMFRSLKSLPEFQKLLEK